MASGIGRQHVQVMSDVCDMADIVVCYACSIGGLMIETKTSRKYIMNIESLWHLKIIINVSLPQVVVASNLV